MTGKEGEEEVLTWHTRCAICHFKVRCRDEKVTRGSKKCVNLLRNRDKEKNRPS